MHEAGRLLVHYLVNSAWQTPLLLIAAWIASRILRKLGCIVQHRLWVAALVLAVLAPLGAIQSSTVSVHLLMDGGAANVLPAPGNSPVAPDLTPGTIHLLPVIYFGMIFGYLIFLAVAGFRLGWGLYKTRRLVRNSNAVALPPDATQIWQRCRSLFVIGGATLASSPEIAGPVTIGTRNALLFIPPGFLSESTSEDLAAALGHECAHIERRDFFLNLLYEIILLPIAYHPAAWVMKSRIAETRELVCDRMAAERITGSQSYAHSLLRLAAAISAEPLPHSHHAIGMFDANTLENRIMNLTTSQPFVSRSRKIILLASGIFLLCLSGAAALALTADVEEQTNNGPQATAEQPQSGAASPEPVAVQQSSSSGPSKSATGSTPQIYKTGELYHVGGGVSAPVVVYSVPAEFSDQALRTKYQGGICVISLVVDTRGKPRQVEVVRHLGMELDHKAVEAVKQYRFKPATLQGKPVPVKVNIEVNFRRY